MYRGCSLRLGPVSERPRVADKNFYLRLAFEKMRMFEVFNEKYIRPYDLSGSNLTAAAKCTIHKMKL